MPEGVHFVSGQCFLRRRGTPIADGGSSKNLEERKGRRPPFRCFRLPTSTEKYEFVEDQSPAPDSREEEERRYA